METLHKVNFLPSVILWEVIYKICRIIHFNNIEVIMINSATMCLYSPSSCLISQLSTTQDFVSLAAKRLSILDKIMRK